MSAKRAVWNQLVPQGTCAVMLLTVLCGCGPGASTEATDATDSRPVPTPTAPARRISDEEGALTVAELREQLGIGNAGQISKVGGQIVAMDLRGTAVKDLTPLTGLPLRQLFLEETHISDLSPLAGMPLEQLYLTNTQVTDLSPLAGMSIPELNLVGTPLEDLSGLADVALKTLWIPQTRVTNLAPLSGKDLVSLDLQDTPVSDLAPLAGNESLRRLHIGGSAVTDLSPLAGLKLERLIVSPQKITAGIEVIRQMDSLTGLDVEFGPGHQVMTPQQFWTRYDAGEWKPAAE